MHTRLRTHAESVAFFGGGAREGGTIGRIFADVLAHLRDVVDIRCGALPPLACGHHHLSLHALILKTAWRRGNPWHLFRKR